MSKVATRQIDVDLPIIGEPFPVKFANTRYETEDEKIDVFADLRTAVQWFDLAPAADALGSGRPQTSATLAELRVLRDAVRTILLGDESHTDSVEVLNRAASSACAHVRLRRSTSVEAFSWSLDHIGAPGARLVAAAAASCIVFLAQPNPPTVRQCERSGCPMLFVQHHRSRRFCSESCTHRVRQARYYQNRPR